MGYDKEKAQQEFVEHLIQTSKKAEEVEREFDRRGVTKLELIVGVFNFIIWAIVCFYIINIFAFGVASFFQERNIDVFKYIAFPLVVSCFIIIPLVMKIPLRWQQAPFYLIKKSAIAEKIFQGNPQRFPRIFFIISGLLAIILLCICCVGFKFYEIWLAQIQANGFKFREDLQFTSETFIGLIIAFYLALAYYAICTLAVKNIKWLWFFPLSLWAVVILTFVWSGTFITIG